MQEDPKVFFSLESMHLSKISRHDLSTYSILAPCPQCSISNCSMAYCADSVLVQWSTLQLRYLYHGQQCMYRTCAMVHSIDSLLASWGTLQIQYLYLAQSTDTELATWPRVQTQYLRHGPQHRFSTCTISYSAVQYWHHSQGWAKLLQ